MMRHLDKSRFTSFLAAAGLLLTASIAAMAAGHSGKITAAQAETLAAKKFHGKAVSSKYEHEDGRWQYAVIVKTGNGKLYEVEVDPNSGKILDSEVTSAREEAREEAADKAAARRQHPAHK